MYQTNIHIIYIKKFPLGRWETFDPYIKKMKHEKRNGSFLIIEFMRLVKGMKKKTKLNLDNIK